MLGISPVGMQQAQGLNSSSNMSRTHSQSFGILFASGDGYSDRTIVHSDGVGKMVLKPRDKSPQNTNAESIQREASLKKVIGQLVNLVGPEKKSELANVLEQYKNIFKK